MLTKEINVKKFFENAVAEIFHSSKRADTIHSSGNIHESGMEVESTIRKIISDFLPERYLVKQGHIINPEGKTSPQLDIIIFDRLSTPKFFETSNNNTVYYPIESVLAIGEIKKTLRNNDVLEFRKKIITIKNSMKRMLIPNTVFGGKMESNSNLFDAVFLNTDMKYRNSLYSFIVSVSSEDSKGVFNIDDNKEDENYASCYPNSVIILDQGFFNYGELSEENKLKFYIEDEKSVMNTWIEAKVEPTITFAIFLSDLIKHLNNSYIQPFTISNYLSNLEDFGIKSKNIKLYNLFNSPKE